MGVPSELPTPRLGFTAIVSAFLALCLFVPSALAAGPTAGITRLGSAPPAQPIQLVLPLKADERGLERLATAVTTPGSPRFGQFQSITTLAHRFGASASDRSVVLGFLRRARATGVKIDATGLFADATMSISVAQRLFGTSLARFHTARAGEFIAPTGTARIPTPLSGAVTGIVGLDTRPLFHVPGPRLGAHLMAAAATFQAHAPSAAVRSGTPLGCPAALARRGFTPNQYLTAYDYAALHSQGIAGQGERVALIEIDGFRDSDLRAFANCFGLGVPAINGYGVGISHPLAPGGEATLDLEVLDAAAPGLKQIDVYESPAQAANVLRALTAPLQNRGRVPQVISASLGSCEPRLLQSIGRPGIRATEGALAAAAASGISVLASSGDAGSTACFDRSGQPIHARAVSYPASSPFVTGVGGTNLALSPGNTIAAQPVWNDGPFNVAAGGGGVSAVFRRPSYQNGFVRPNRRVVPDVSMLADVLPGYAIYCTVRGDCLNAENPSNPWIAVGGTSAAAPLLAGGLALVDQVLRAQKRQRLGAANPLLYALNRSAAGPSLFYDVTTGDNDLGPFIGTHRSVGCCSAGSGYDYASGLGSLDLARLAWAAVLRRPRLASVGVSRSPQRPAVQRR